MNTINDNLLPSLGNISGWYQYKNVKIKLKGKDVVFKVKVHEVKRRVLPEINEEFFNKFIEVKNVGLGDKDYWIGE